jgi:hypothetical protein
LFGGFWQNLSKAQRRRGITIGGEAVATLDYAQMAPRTLYGLAGIEPPQDDAYILPGLESHRDGVKRVFNSLLFTDKPLKRFPQDTRRLFPPFVRLEQVVQRIQTRHHPVSHLFCIGIGFKLMFIESQCLIDVLLSLIDRSIVALPVHDAVIVPVSAVGTAKTSMLETFRRYTGMEGSVEEEKD